MLDFLKVSYFILVAGVCSLFLSSPVSAETLKVTSEYAPLYLGHKVMGYLPEGTKVRPVRKQNDEYLVEIIVDGRFKSFAWLNSGEVIVIEDDSEELEAGTVPSKSLAVAYRDIGDAKGYSESAEYAKIDYNETGGDPTGGAAIIKVSDEPPDPTSNWEHQITTRTFHSPDENTPGVFNSTDMHPPDVDLTLAKAPTSTPENPIVSKKPLPYMDSSKHKEKTLGRGTLDMFGDMSTTDMVVATVLLVLIGSFLLWAIFGSHGDPAKRRRGRALR